MTPLPFRPLLSLLLVLSLAACAPPRQPPMPVGDLKLGQAHFTHPETMADLLAGYPREDVPAVEEKVLGEMDLLFSRVLALESPHSYIGPEKSLACARSLKIASPERQSALRKWSAVGRCMEVDLLIVPQILEWREREGAQYAASAPAGVIMDTYVLDVRGESLISRSHYDATQSALAANLLDLDTFLKRGGKWVQAGDLAREGMEKAVKELGL